MKNKYTVVCGVVYIEIAATRGKNPLPQKGLVIDLKNINKIRDYPGTWVQSIHQHTGKVYIRGNRYTKDSDQPVLPRVIAQPKNGYCTRHLDGNPFNCLESNLVNVKLGVKSIEGLAPIGPPPEPEEEVKPSRGVSWHKTKKRWEVKPTFEGKRVLLGYWHEDQLNEANEAIQFFRENGPEAYAEKYGAK